MDLYRQGLASIRWTQSHNIRSVTLLRQRVAARFPSGLTRTSYQESTETYRRLWQHSRAAEHWPKGARV